MKTHVVKHRSSYPWERISAAGAAQSKVQTSVMLIQKRCSPLCALLITLTTFALCRKCLYALWKKTSVKNVIFFSRNSGQIINWYQHSFPETSRFLWFTLARLLASFFKIQHLPSFTVGTTPTQNLNVNKQLCESLMQFWSTKTCSQQDATNWTDRFRDLSIMAIVHTTIRKWASSVSSVISLL